MKTVTRHPDGRDVEDRKQTKFDLREAVFGSRNVSSYFDSGDPFDSSPKDLTGSVCPAKRTRLARNPFQGLQQADAFDQIHNHRAV